MVKHQGGYLINARIVSIESKAVVTSAQRFIPSSVTNALLVSSAKQPRLMELNDYSTIDLTDYENSGTAANSRNNSVPLIAN